jgi:hypothetical protein
MNFGAKVLIPSITPTDIAIIVTNSSEILIVSRDRADEDQSVPEGLIVEMW